MENRAHAIAAVTFLIVLSVGAYFIYFWLSSAPAAPRVYRIVTDQSAAGLASQSAVMFKGLQVGHVESVHFDPQNPSHVVIDFRVQRDAYVTESTYAVIALKGLLGGKVLKLKLGKGSREPLETSADNPAHIPLRQGVIGQLKEAARKNLKGLHTLLNRINQLLGKKNRQRISEIIEQLDTLTSQLVKLEKRLAPAIKQLPKLLANVNKALNEARGLIANANQLIKQAHVPLKKAGQLEQTLQRLARKLNRQTLPGIQQLTRSLTRTSRQLRQLTRELKANPQSLIFGAPQPKPGPGEPGFGTSGG